MALLLLGVSLPLLVGWSHLPEPVATHWRGGGAPDASSSKLGIMLVLTLIGLLPLAGVGSKLRDAFRVPTALATLAFVGVLATSVSVQITLMNWNRGGWSAAREPGLLGLALVLGLPAAAASLAYLLARRFYPEVRRRLDELPALSLVAGERAYWSGSAANRWLWLLALALTAFTSIVSRGAGPLALIGPVVTLLAAASLATVRVTIDERGVAIRYGLLGWPCQRIALSRIRSAQAFELAPLEHGGWGYRGSLTVMGRAAVVVRAGLALRLELEGEQRLCITVDHADEAAKLINGFVARGRTAVSSLD
ncbi:MAG: DUF1648 domain-containing protein [Polyangiaceae bacterium]